MQRKGVKSIEEIFPRNSLDNLNQIVENENIKYLFWLKDLELKLLNQDLLENETEENRLEALYTLGGELEYVKRISRTRPTGDATYLRGLREVCDMDVMRWRNRRNQYISYYIETGKLQETEEVNDNNENHSNEQSGFSNWRV